MASMNLKCSKCDYQVHVDMRRGHTPTHKNYEAAAQMFGLTPVDGKYVCKECLQTAGEKKETKGNGKNKE